MCVGVGVHGSYGGIESRFRLWPFSKASDGGSADERVVYVSCKI